MTDNDRKIITVKAMSFRKMVSKLVSDLKAINDSVISKKRGKNLWKEKKNLKMIDKGVL